MKKFYKFLKSFIFISIWLILSSFLTQFWNTFHWEYIYLNFRIIFDREFWFVAEKFLLGFDIGYWLEEALKFLNKVGEFIFLKTNKVPLSPLQILSLLLK